MYEPPTHSSDSNPYQYSTQEYHRFEDDRSDLRAETNRRMVIQPVEPVIMPPEITASPKSFIFLKLGGISLALGVVTWYFGWQEIPLIGNSFWLFYAGGILIATGLFPVQVGGLLLLAGVAVIFIRPSGMALSEVSSGNWIVGIGLIIIGIFIAATGRD